ncbi:MAG TPA: 50S ribosomal protein L7/L12 [Xanthobacteraceae bacterium]|nr:50S ribosomal protein L7/L12 [Xanthobacteraceae bacterium]
MADVLIMYGLPLIVLIAAAVWIYMHLTPENWKGSSTKVPNQGVVKRDWVATGRIDFATQLTTTPGDNDRPSEFKLLVEERRIVESIAGNENLEIQWRLATLREAKTVVTQYHTYLSENSLIKTVFDEPASLPPPVEAQINRAAAPAEEKSEFTVVLAAVGEKKIEVIKEVSALTGLGLKEAKDLVEGAPKPVKKGVNKDEADRITATLEKAGAKAARVPSD